MGVHIFKRNEGRPFAKASIFTGIMLHHLIQYEFYIYIFGGGYKQQALCVVQSPTSEEEPLGSNVQSQPNCHHHQSVDGSLEEETSGRCGTPTGHRQSRRRRPLSTEPALSSSSKPTSGRNLAPPAPTAPVKSHYKVKCNNTGDIES